jgi:cytochrome c-type biogenesis protein CcmF
MLPEVGHFATVIALVLATLLAIIPMIGAQRSNLLWMMLARPLALGQFYSG